MTLVNFQGIKQKEFNFGGKSASIIGNNATGKSTVFNAFTYLLTGQASTGAKNFNPKPTDKDGNGVHFLDSTVSLVIQLDGGRIVTLSKVFKEDWRQKKGSVNKEFAGHNIEYAVDGVPAKEKEFNAALGRFFGDAERIKLLTMPNYFPEVLPWEARRKLLLEYCGDVSDEDVINSTGELKELKSFLLMPGTADQFYTVDDYKAIAKKQRTEIDSKIKSIPDRIDEAEKAKPDVEGKSLTKIKAQRKSLEESKQAWQEAKAMLTTGDTGTTEFKKQIAELQTQLAKGEIEAIKAHNEMNKSVNDSISQLQIYLNNEMMMSANNDLKLRKAKNDLTYLREKREDCLVQYAKVKAIQWDDAQAVCPACKRELDSEVVENLKEEFNIKRSQDLEKINLKGQTECSKEMIAQKEDDIEGLESAIADNQRVVELHKFDIDEARGKLITEMPAPEGKADIEAQIKALNAKIEQAKEGTFEQLKATTEEIIKVDTELKQLGEEESKFATIKIQEKRIEELKAQEKDLAKEYQDIVKGLFLCESFIRAKVNMLDDTINSKFQNVRFSLFKEQINGGLAEICEVLVPSDTGELVPYAISNNAGRINAGLEIIDTLGKHWGCQMPVFVDNAEGINELFKTDTQVIRLVVPAQYESVVECPFESEEFIAMWKADKKEYEDKCCRLRLEVDK